MNNFFATGLRLILAVLMIFQSIFAPITYAFMIPEIDNQEIEQGIYNTVTQELITIPSVPGYEGSGGEKEMEEMEEVEEAKEVEEVKEVKEDKTGINDIFIQKSEGVREYITLVNDTPEGIKKRALTILELEDIFLSGLVISDLEGSYFDNAIVFEGGKTILVGLNAELLEAYIQSQGNGAIDTGGLEDGIQENVFEIILPTSEVKTDAAGRFVLESVESVNVLSNQYQYCSLLSRTNLERLTEALQSKEIIIYQGNAITLIEEGIKNKSLQEYSNQGLSDFFAKQKYQTVFDLYMYTPKGDSNGDEENYEAYINQGHRVVVFQATDQQRYVLDTLRGKKTITPQLLSDYLASNEFDQSILYLRIEGYGKGYAPIEVQNASQFVVYAGQGKIAAEFNDLGLPIAARFNVPFVFLPEVQGPKVTLPQGLYVRTRTGEPFAITSLGLTELLLNDLKNENIDITQVKGLVEFGIPGQGLLFDRPVQIEIPVDLPDGSLLEVKVKHGDADNFGIEGITTNPNATCNKGSSSEEGNVVTVQDRKAVFWTCAASTFVINALGSSNLKLWLKANLGTSCLTNNCVLTGWNDQSGLGNNATGTGTSLPRYISSFRNFNPAILFTGGYFHTLNDGGVQDDMTLIAVYRGIINYAVDNNFSILRNDAALILFRTMKEQVWKEESFGWVEHQYKQRLSE